MTMKKGLLIMFLAALMAVAPCWAIKLQASGCYQQRVYYNNYPHVVNKVEVVEKQVIVATLVPLVVTVPTYSATYVQGYQQAQVTPAQAVAQGYPQQPQGQSFDVNALNQVLTAINTRLTTIESSIQGGVSANAQGAATANDAVVLFKAKCASCHGEAPRDNKFSMFKGGQLAQLTDRQVGKVLSRISRNVEQDPAAMPPGPKHKTGDSNVRLTDKEMSLAAAWCDAMLQSGEAPSTPAQPMGPSAPTQPSGNGQPK